MKVFFGQIYIEPGVKFPFSTDFQGHLSKAISKMVVPSKTFIKKFGPDYALVFNISAKMQLRENEVRGPTVFSKTKDVEYSIFLPFAVIVSEPDVPRAALGYLLRGVCSVFEQLDIDHSTLNNRREQLINEICADPNMFNSD